MADSNVKYGPNRVYTFGVSRVSMAKIHVDDINGNAKKNIASPGPGTYEKSKTFAREGQHSSFASKLEYDHVSLKRAKNLPGPGHYESPSLLSNTIKSSLKRNSIG